MHFGLDLIALQEKGINFMLEQAANWARIPTRLNRAEAARAIVEQAALQQRVSTVAETMAGIRPAITQIRETYDSASSKVADVVDKFRVLPPGAVPPLSLLPKATEVVALVGAVTAALTKIEQSVAENAKRVLTTEQLAQLNTGLSFPKFMGTQAKTLLTYLVVGGVVYFGVRALARSGGTRSW